MNELRLRNYQSYIAQGVRDRDFMNQTPHDVSPHGVEVRVARLVKALSGRSMIPGLPLHRLMAAIAILIFVVIVLPWWQIPDAWRGYLMMTMCGLLLLSLIITGFIPCTMAAWPADY